MNASELKRKVEANNPDSLFFSRNNMKFSGDTMRNYGVRTAKIMTKDGEKEVWELYRRQATRHGFTRSVYWDPLALEQAQRRPHVAHVAGQLRGSAN